MLGCARELERQKVKLQVEVQQPLNVLAMQLRLRGCGDDEHDSTQPDEWCDMGGTQQEDCGVSFEPDPPQLLQVEDGEVRPWLSTLLPVDDRGVLNIGRTVTGLRLHDDARTAGSYLAHGAHATITNEQGCFVLRLAPARAGSGGMMTYINEAGYRVLNFNHFTYDPGPIPLAHGDTLRFGGTYSGVDSDYSKFIFMVDAATAVQPDRDASPLPAPPPARLPRPPKPPQILTPMLPPPPKPAETAESPVLPTTTAAPARIAAPSHPASRAATGAAAADLRAQRFG